MKGGQTAFSLQNRSPSTNSNHLLQTDSSPSNSTKMDMQIHEEFTKWAVTQGVIINEVSPFRFPGKGLGLVANKDFEVQELSWKIAPFRKISCLLINL